MNQAFSRGPASALRRIIQDRLLLDGLFSILIPALDSCFQALPVRSGCNINIYKKESLGYLPPGSSS